MQDPQFPPEDDNANGDQPRRASSLRLRDAEAVATTRRDMFGDGSLIETLTGPAPAQDPAQDEVRDIPQADPPQSNASDAGSLDAGSPDAGQPDPPSRPEEPQSPPAAADAGSRSARKKPEPGFANPAASPFAQVPQSLDSIIDSFASEGGAPDEPPPDPAPKDVQPAPPPRPAPARLAVSSIFDSLSEEATQQAGEPTASGAFGPDMSMLEPMLSGPPTRAAFDGPLRPYPAPDYGPVHTADQNQDQAHDPQSDRAADDGLAAPPAPTPSRGPLRLVSSGPYPDLPPRWPPAEPPEAMDAPPEPGLPEMPSFAEPREPAFVAPLTRAPLSVPAEVAYSPPHLEPLVTTVVPEPEEDAARPMYEANVRIAAEASATAEALDNLKHLLGHDAPGMERPVEQPIRPPGLAGPPLNLLGEPTQFNLHERAPMLPLPVPPERTRVKGVYLLGFLTGLGLALVAGIALYLLMLTVG